MPLNQVLFAVLALVAVGSALGVVLFPSPVRSALSLVVTLFSLAMIYFGLGAQFLGITQIMVYAGAIMVLFLFVIMILKMKPEGENRRIETRQVAGFLFAGIICVAISALIMLPLHSSLREEVHEREFQATTDRVDDPYDESNIQATTIKVDDSYGEPQAIGRELFTTYVWPFEVASVLLLVGVVGSVMLAKKRF